MKTTRKVYCYLLLSADNVDSDILVEQYASKKEARKAMKSAVLETVSNIIHVECNLKNVCEMEGVEVELSDNYASVLEEGGGDYFYFNIKPVYEKK